ncbi:MAG: IgA Peptidase M64 [Holophagales bacterium]|nr:MAG: IgA Peptidase M64 [Holophagales bacterium]
MIHRPISLALFAALVAVAPAAMGADSPRTLRVDYFHTGNAREERFSLERIVLEPLPWPGDPAKAIDDTNLGKYFFEVIDRATHRVLYSRGFSSVYGEWETTGEAATLDRTFSESLRFPRPEAPVQLVLKKRDRVNDFREVWSLVVDPGDMLVDASRPPSAGELIAFQRSGESRDKLDFLILGDGYTAAERGKCEADARRLLAVLFAVEPFKSRQNDLNVWGLCPAAAESGISRPSLGVHHRSPAGATYDAFRSERYILTFDNRAFRDLASQAPYEVVEILANGRTYGGGGIFGQYSTVAADSLWAPYVFVHEFGHHLAALADEYYTSDVAYEPAADRTEPWEPNVTALLDPTRLKWRDLVVSVTPIPTPWEKEAYEQRSREIQAERRKLRATARPEEEIDALFTRQRDEEEKRLGGEKHAGRVGAFEGASYEARGLYRPQVDCIMFSRDRVPFCPVCRRGIERVIDLYARRR